MWNWSISGPSSATRGYPLPRSITVKLFEEASILERHDFGDGRARYEERPESHHDHLIDVKTGEVVEFSNEEIERLQAEVARALGYRLVDHRMELFGDIGRANV